jgi:hypothetical protein
VPSNPLDRIKPPACTHEWDRILSDAELGAVWHAAFKLMKALWSYVSHVPVTGHRRCDVSEMTWSKVTGDIWKASSPTLDHFRLVLEIVRKYAASVRNRSAKEPKR